jgi:hypothetical protein
MGTFSGPKIVTDGLILDLDVANAKSFMDAANTSLINTSTWVAGNTSPTGFSVNQTVANENQLIANTDPYGQSNMIWHTHCSGDGNQDGGWNESSWNTADKTKLYRYSVWVKRTSSSASGTFYFGLYTNGSGTTYHLSDGASQTNPYFDYRGTGSLTQNQWYLFVGHLFPHNHTGTTAHPDSGYYYAGNSVKIGNNAGNVPNDVKFPSDATGCNSRVYHFYSGDATTRLQFAYPRIDVCDGNQPSIAQLVSQGPAVIKDNSGRGNHHYLSGYYVPNSSAPRKFDITESNWITRSGALSGVTSTCTVVMWYSTTDTQELWVRGNDSGGVYLSASYGNPYYHSGCGSPTNYVDLATVTNPETPVDYRDGTYRMWEAKGVDFSGWTKFDWFGYGTTWNMTGKLSRIMVYNKNLSADESARNFAALRGRFGI